MPTATAIAAPRLIGTDGVRALFEVLVADGYHVIGPAGVLGRVPSEPPPPPCGGRGPRWKGPRTA
jgi:hypothetical protein